MGDVFFDHLIRKKLAALDNEIADEEFRLGKIRARMSRTEWANKRASLTKHLYNLYETRQVILLKSVFPGRTFYAQANYAAIELPDGRQIPIENRRIPDVIEILGDEVQPHDLKTRNAILKSVKGGLIKNQQLEVDFKDSAYLKEQLLKEKFIIDRAIKLNGKIIINAIDPLHQSSVRIRIDPKKLHISIVMEYGKIPDKLLGNVAGAAPPLTTGLTPKTLGSVAKDGSVLVEKRNATKLADIDEKPSAQVRSTSGGKPTMAQRSTPLDRPEETLTKPAVVKGETKTTTKPTEATSSKPYRGLANKGIGGANIFLGGASVISLANQFKDISNKRMEISLSGMAPSDYEVGQKFVIEDHAKEGTYRVIITVGTNYVGTKRFYVTSAGLLE